MKYFLLLCAASVSNLGLFGQQFKIDPKVLHDHLKQKNTVAAGARKTTSVPPCWYNYGDALDTSFKYEDRFGMGQQFLLAPVTIWNDTNGIIYDSGHIYHHVQLLSEADMFQPQYAIFNNDEDSAYVGQMYISDTDAYEVDSVEIFGMYLYNSTKSTEVDTLRLAFLTGNGKNAYDNFYVDTTGLMGKYTWGTWGIHYESTHNTATGINTANLYPATASHTLDILLDNTTWNDTLPGGIWHRTVAVNGATGMLDSADFYGAVSITYISGDPATHTGILSTPSPGDTLTGSTWKGWGNSKYNVWCPLVGYYSTLGTGVPDWAPYNLADSNAGYWRQKNTYNYHFRDLFIPLWAFSSYPGGSAPTVLQFPYVSWYVASCPTCGLVMKDLRHAPGGINNLNLINNITAYPDPAINELHISFTTVYNTEVSVTLTNEAGEEVAKKTVNNLITGNVVFNTADLPSGIYIYTLSANGTRSTGRIAIVH